MIERVEMVLCPLFKRSHPFLITMARSTSDGFTPPHIVEQLQIEILGMLQRLASKEDCQLQITKDYGEREGSTLPI